MVCLEGLQGETLCFSTFNMTVVSPQWPQTSMNWSNVIEKIGPKSLPTDVKVLQKIIISS